jgi:hypothetical protein
MKRAMTAKKKAFFMMIVICVMEMISTHLTQNCAKNEKRYIAQLKILILVKERGMKME